MIRFATLALALALAGCSNPFAGKSAPPPACPQAGILDDADRLTVYREGAGRDIADVAYEASIIGFVGDCSYDIEKKSKDAKEQTYSAVTMNLRARFRVTPGPALAGSQVPLKYFVAIPQFYPHPEGRADFSRMVDILPMRTPIELTDANIEIRIPLNERRRGPDLSAYFGFDLTEEQLRENRLRPAGRLAQ